MKVAKQFYLLIVILFLSLSVQAQESPLTFGIKGGINLSNLSGNIKDSKPKIGYQGGITLDYRITPDIFIFTGLELTNKGAKEKDAVLADGNIKSKHNPLYLQIPLHAAYKMMISESSNIALHAGPYVAYGISGKYKTEINSNLIGIENKNPSIDYFGDKGFAKRFDYGFGLGISAEVNKFVLNIGFDVGLANIANDITMLDSKGEIIKAGNDHLKMRNQNSYLTLGYKF